MTTPPRNFRARVAEKGQVVIPKPLRDRLGIRPGQELDFVEQGGRLVITKVSAQSAVDAVYGSWGTGRRSDELMDELRGKPEEFVGRPEKSRPRARKPGHGGHGGEGE